VRAEKGKGKKEGKGTNKEQTLSDCIIRHADWARDNLGNKRESKKKAGTVGRVREEIKSVGGMAHSFAFSFILHHSFLQLHLSLLNKTHI
jgi:hypothetical protein